jgi:hypothetical protein
MRLYFEGDQMRRSPQPRKYRVGICEMVYDRSLRLWRVIELDSGGNAVVQPTGEEAVYAPTKGEAIDEAFHLTRLRKEATA